MGSAVIAITGCRETHHQACPFAGSGQALSGAEGTQRHQEALDFGSLPEQPCRRDELVRQTPSPATSRLETSEVFHPRFDLAPRSGLQLPLQTGYQDVSRICSQPVWLETSCGPDQSEKECQRQECDKKEEGQTESVLRSRKSGNIYCDYQSGGFTDDGLSVSTSGILRSPSKASC